jgi:DNA-binding CsgD family transcriptional regulator
MHVVQEAPFIGVRYECPEAETAPTRIAEIAIGTGIIAVTSANCELEDKYTQAAIVGSITHTNKAAADILNTEEVTLKEQLRVVYEILCITKRTALARALFDLDVYDLCKQGESLNLTPAQCSVVGTLSYGQTSKQTADLGARSFSTIKAHIARVSNRTGWKNREQITIAALVGRDVRHTGIEAHIKERRQKESLRRAQILRH